MDEERAARLWADAAGGETLGASQAASAPAALGMMLHQDGSKHLWVAALGRQIDLIVTMDDATSELYSSFLIEAEGTASSLRGLHEAIARHGLFCTFYTARGGHYFFAPKAGSKVDKDTPTQTPMEEHPWTSSCAAAQKRMKKHCTRSRNACCHLGAHGMQMPLTNSDRAW